MNRILALLILMMATSPLFGQSLPSEQLAELAFEVRMERFRDNPLFDHLRNMMLNAPGMEEARDFDLNMVDSVFVAIALPENVEGIQAMQNAEQTQEVPFEIFAKIKFVDSQSAEAWMEKVREESDEKTIGGTTYLAPKEGSDGPKNMIGHLADSTTAVFGTETYVTSGAGTDVLSEGLKTAWESVPDDGFRMAIDLEHCSALIEEAVEMGKQSGNPMMGGMMDLPLTIRNLRLSADLAGGNLLTLGATGKDSANAKKFAEGLNAFLAVGKMTGQAQAKQVGQANPEAGRVMGEILQALVAKQDGNEIRVEIPKPEGFENVVMAMMSMMGGGGPPGR